MESFWESIRDGALLLLKVFLVLFIIDAVLYYYEYRLEIPFVRLTVIRFFHMIGYSRPY